MAIAGAVISAIAVLLAAIIGTRATGRESRSRFSVPDVDASRRVRLLRAEVHPLVYERPRRAPWRRRLVSLSIVAAVGLSIYVYSTVQYTVTDLGDLWWAVVSVPFGGLGAASLGLFIGMLQFGFEGAETQGREVQVEGDVPLVFDRSCDALGKMKARVLRLALHDDVTLIDACRLGAPNNLSIRVDSAGRDRCSVRVTAARQPSITSARKNAGDVSQFLGHLTGVLVYPGAFVPEKGDPRNR